MAHPWIFYLKSLESLKSHIGCETVLYREAFDDIDITKDIYFITWNPKPKYYFNGMDKKNIMWAGSYEEQWYEMSNLLLQGYKSLSTYAFVPELSHTGKLHMHGFYQISDEIKFKKSFISSLIRRGFIKENKVMSVQWKNFQYHLKDISITREFIKNNQPLIITPALNQDMRKLAINFRIQQKAYTNYNMLPKNKRKILNKNVLQMILPHCQEYEDDSVSL